MVELPSVDMVPWMPPVHSSTANINVSRVFAVVSCILHMGSSVRSVKVDTGSNPPGFEVGFGAAFRM